MSGSKASGSSASGAAAPLAPGLEEPNGASQAGAVFGSDIMAETLRRDPANRTEAPGSKLADARG